MGRACCYMGLHRCTMTIYSSFKSHLKQYPEYQYYPLIVLKRACCFFQYFFSQHLFFVAHWSEPKFRNFKFQKFTLISRRKSPEARAAGVLFVLSKDKNTCVNASAQTDLYPKAEKKQEAQKYRIISNFGNTEICS